MSGNSVSQPNIDLYNSAMSPFKGQTLTQAGRGVTKHPQYFGFEDNNSLRSVYRSDAELNGIASERLKDVLTNGIMTRGTPTAHYPSGWITYTLPNGNAASWGLDGGFIGFRGVK